jgi:hypothetical protein
MRAKTISDILKPKSREELEKAFSDIKIGSYNLYPFVYKLWDKPFKIKELLRDIVVNKLKLELKDLEIALLYKYSSIKLLFDNILESDESENSLIEFEKGFENGLYMNYNEDRPVKNDWGEYRQMPLIYFKFSRKYQIIKIEDASSGYGYYIFPKNLNFKNLYL